MRKWYTFGEAYTINIMEGYTSLHKRIVNHFQSPFAVVKSRIAGLKPFSGWSDVCVSDIGEHSCCTIA
jgi:hypothetical protein